MNSSHPEWCVVVEAHSREHCTNDISLFGREAICEYRKLHGKRNAWGQLLPFNNEPVPSSTPNLAFFTPRPGQEFDTYYDGCRGWD